MVDEIARRAHALMWIIRGGAALVLFIWLGFSYGWWAGMVRFFEHLLRG